MTGAFCVTFRGNVLYLCMNDNLSKIALFDECAEGLKTVRERTYDPLRTREDMNMEKLNVEIEDTLEKFDEYLQTYPEEDRMRELVVENREVLLRLKTKF